MLDETIKKLKTIKLRWFDNFDIGFTKLPLKVAELDKEGKSYLYFCQLLFSCFFSRVSFSFEKKENSKIICFFYNHLGNNRSDIQSLHDGVMKTIDNKDIIRGKARIKFHPFLGIKHSLKIIVWSYQLRKIKLALRERLMLLRKLIEVSFFNVFLTKTMTDDLRRYNLLLVFNDSVPYDNFLVQKFKLMDIKTATLQHGIILAPTLEDNYDFCGIELRCSNSDYFLAWNRFTQKQALKTGIPHSKVKILGIPKCLSLNYKIVMNITCDENIFGVVLDGEYTKESNELLIKIANEYSEQTGMNYILRFHPKMDIHKYDDLLTDKCIGISPKTDSIHYFCQNVRFSILANSTVFIEMVFYRHQVYRMTGIENLCKYKDVLQCSFTDTNDLLKKIDLERLGETTERTELYEELVTIENIKESYQSFFKKYTTN